MKHNRRRLLFTASSLCPLNPVLAATLGGEHALIQLSEDTGGKYFYAMSNAQLDAAFQRISDELRTQYLLAYYPSEKGCRIRISG